MIRCAGQSPLCSTLHKKTFLQIRPTPSKNALPDPRYHDIRRRKPYNFEDLFHDKRYGNDEVLQNYFSHTLFLCLLTHLKMCSWICGISTFRFYFRRQRCDVACVHKKKKKKTSTVSFMTCGTSTSTNCCRILCGPP